jgi:hypothetical protein
MFFVAHSGAKVAKKNESYEKNTKKILAVDNKSM